MQGAPDAKCKEEEKLAMYKKRQLYEMSICTYETDKIVLNDPDTKNEKYCKQMF